MDKQFVDCPTPDKYLNHLADLIDKFKDVPHEETLDDMFMGGASDEFYKGMLAGSRAYVSVLCSVVPNMNELATDLIAELHMSIFKKMQNNQVTGEGEK